MTDSIYNSPNSDVQTDSAFAEPMGIKEILFSFKGRIPRKIYWLASLASLVVVMIAIVLVGALFSEPGILGVIAVALYVPLIWISLAVQVKRWHDRDKSGWWVLISFVPIIGPFWALIENGFLAGTEGPNRFGAPQV